MKQNLANLVSVVPPPPSAAKELETILAAMAAPSSSSSTAQGGGGTERCLPLFGGKFTLAVKVWSPPPPPPGGVVETTTDETKTTIQRTMEELGGVGGGGRRDTTDGTTTTTTMEEELDGVEPSKRILCWPGWLDNAGSFDSIAPFLTDKGYLLVCCDPPGCGRSDHYSVVTKYNDFLEPAFVMEALRVLGWWASPCNLMAHSRY
jgi:pimeloyl-ACP methyl ester carboxylesterase